MLKFKLLSVTIINPLNDVTAFCSSYTRRNVSIATQKIILLINNLYCCQYMSIFMVIYRELRKTSLILNFNFSLTKLDLNNLIGKNHIRSWSFLLVPYSYMRCSLWCRRLMHSVTRRSKFAMTCSHISLGIFAMKSSTGLWSSITFCVLLW